MGKNLSEVFSCCPPDGLKWRNSRDIAVKCNLCEVMEQMCGDCFEKAKQGLTAKFMLCSVCHNWICYDHCQLYEARVYCEDCCYQKEWNQSITMNTKIFHDFVTNLTILIAAWTLTLCMSRTNPFPTFMTLDKAVLPEWILTGIAKVAWIIADMAYRESVHDLLVLRTFATHTEGWIAATRRIRYSRTYTLACGTTST